MTLSLTFIALSIAFPGAQDSSDGWSQESLEAASLEVQGEVGRLRGVEFEGAVRVEIADKAGLIEYAVKRMDEMQLPKAMENANWTAHLLGLLTPEQDLEAMTMEVLKEQVGGFYDPGTKSFYLMEGFTGDLARVILAHELTHALDDRLYDLDGALKARIGNSDQTTAYMSVVEGSGSAVMNRWVMANAGKLDPASMREFSKMGTAALQDTPAVIWKPLLATYMTGQRFLSIGVRQLRTVEKVRDPNAALERAFAKPPRSSEQILHPEKYWVPEDIDEPIMVERERVDLPEGWTLAQEDTFGEMQLALVTELVNGHYKVNFGNPMSMMNIKYTNAAAAGWGGDSLGLYAKGAGRLLHLVTVWDNEEEAEEFEQAMSMVIEDFIEPNLALLAGEEGGHGAHMTKGGSPTERVLAAWALPDGSSDEAEELLKRLRWEQRAPVEEAPEEPKEE